MFEKPKKLIGNKEGEFPQIDRQKESKAKQQEKVEGIILNEVGLGSEDQVEQLVGNIQRLVDDLDEIEDPEEKKKFSLKIFHTLKRITQGVVGATTLLAVIGGANYGRTRYEISEKQTKDGIEYSHEDPETTKNLNILLGKEPLPEDLKIKMYQDILVDEYHALHMDIPEDLLNMNEEALKIQHRKIHEVILGQSGRGIDLDADDELAKSAGRMMRFSSEVYQVVWNFEKEYGSPKIRFTFSVEKTQDEDLELMAQPGRSRYESLSNTLYINPLEKGKGFFAEISHAKQYHENPGRAFSLGFTDSIRSHWRAFIEGKTYQKVREYEYDTPGTLEYEAHNVLEKDIIARIGRAYEESSKRGH